ncbi:MAG: hypothetical protein R3C44_07030 [Chloroflexota bacterium]
MDYSNAPIVLEAKGITKQFPGVLANDHIDPYPLLGRNPRFAG